MTQTLTNIQISILLRLRNNRLILTGSESDEKRLSLLQLYMLGYVAQLTHRYTNVMEWHITERGKIALSNLND